MTTPDLADPKLYINRELSWLAFNRRVLEEAQDETQPLLERVRFLGIVASNLDEFFEVRVAGIKQQIEHESDDSGPDGMSPRQTFAAIRQDVLELIDDKYQLWHHELKPALAEHGVHLHDFTELSDQDKEWATTYFHNEVFPVLTPLAVDASHPFPAPAEQEPQSFPAPAAARAPHRVAPRRRADSPRAAAARPAPLLQGRRVALRSHPEPDPGPRARSFSRPGSRAGLRLPPHPQQRPLHRRGGGGKSPAHDRGRIAQARPRQRRAAGDRARLPARHVRACCSISSS